MDFQSAMETFAEAWVAANSAPAPAPKIGINNNSSIESNNNHCGGSAQQQESSSGATGAENTENSAQQKCDTMLNLSTSSDSPANGGVKSPSDPQSPPPQQRTLSPAPIGMDLSPPNRRSRSSSAAAPPQQNTRKSPKAPTAQLQQRQASPCLGKSIPIHCIVEILGENTKNGLVINNNNNWEFGKHSNKDKAEPDKDNQEDKQESGAKSPSEAENADESDGSQSKSKIDPENEDVAAADSPTTSADSSTPPPAPPNHSGIVDVDDFVIIPAQTRFHDVVPTVLTLLGYPIASIRGSTASIALRNWKPLSLHQVCEPCDQHRTVGDIFNDLTHHAVLRILIQAQQRSTRGNLAAASAAAGASEGDEVSVAGSELKEKLLRLLLRQSSATGRKDYANAAAIPAATTTDEDADTDPAADADTDEVAVKSAEGDSAGPPWLLEDVNHRFDMWYASQHQHTIAGLVQSLLQQDTRLTSKNLSESSNESLLGNNQRKRRSSSSSSDRDKESHRERRDAAARAVNGSNLLNGPSLSAATDKNQNHSNDNSKNDESHYRNSLQAIAAAATGNASVRPPSPTLLPATLPHAPPASREGGSVKSMTMQDIINHRQSQSQVAPTATPNFFLDECTNELLVAAAAAAAAAHDGRPNPHHGMHPDLMRRDGTNLGPAGLHSMHRQPGQHSHPHQHPVFHNFTSQKTRMRTSFDPEMELPKLQSWFQENPHPSRQQIQQYVRDLNLLDCRKDRKPLDVNNVIYWFKNARAAQKRNEMRYNGLPSLNSTSSPRGGQQQRSPMLSPYSASMAAFHNQQPGDLLRRHYLDPHGDGDGDEDGGSDEDDEYMQQHQQERERRGRSRSRSQSRSRSPKRAAIKEEFEEGASLPVNVEIHEGVGVGHGLTNGKREPASPNHGPSTTGEPKDFTNDKSRDHDAKHRRTSSTTDDRDRHFEDDGGAVSNLSTSTASPGGSLSPRSCSPVSPGRSYLYGPESLQKSSMSMSPPTSVAAAAAAAMLNRFHPFFDHPSFLAYHRHLNSLHFGGNAPGSPLENGPAVQAAAYEQALAAMAGMGRGGNGKGQPPDLFARRPDHREIDLPHNLLGNLRSPTGATPPGRHHPYSNLFGGPPTAGSPPNQQSRPSLMSPPDGPGRLGVGGPSAELISSIINSSSARHAHAHAHAHDLSNHPNNAHILGLASHHGSGQGTIGGSHQQHHHSRTSPTLVLSSAALDERRKRNRTFIDPVTEVPRLEQWFTLNTHPSHNLILKYTEELNRMPYRQKFPRLEPKNVQFWFKNRRAKCKRLKMTM